MSHDDSGSQPERTSLEPIRIVLAFAIDLADGGIELPVPCARLGRGGARIRLTSSRTVSHRRCLAVFAAAGTAGRAAPVSPTRDALRARETRTPVPGNVT